MVKEMWECYFEFRVDEVLMVEPLIPAFMSGYYVSFFFCVYNLYLICNPSRNLAVR